MNLEAMTPTPTPPPKKPSHQFTAHDYVVGAIQQLEFAMMTLGPGGTQNWDEYNQVHAVIVRASGLAQRLNPNLSW